MSKKLKIEFLLLKGESTRCSNERTFKNLLGSDSEVTFKGQKVLVNTTEVGFKVVTDLIEVGKSERYFIVTLEKNTEEGNEQNTVDELILVYRKLKNVISESGKEFTIAPLWDDTAFYYSKLSYPLIYEVENLLRQLIHKFMLTKLGGDWSKSTTPSELKSKLESKDKETKNANIETLLFNADFNQLQNFLFREYKIESNTVFDKIRKAKNITDLNFEELKQIVPENNWNRYFKEIITYDKFIDNWEKLYILRCKVAHNTFITKGNYNEISKLTKEFKSIFEQAIDSIAKINIAEEDKTDLTQSAFVSFYDVLKNNQSLFDTIKTVGNVRDQLLENSSFTNLMSSINEVKKNINFQIPNLIGIKKCSKCNKEFIPKSFTLGQNEFICEECKDNDRLTWAIGSMG